LIHLVVSSANQRSTRFSHELPPRLPRARSRRGRAAPRGVPRRRRPRKPLPAFDAFAKGIRIWQQELLAYFDEPTTNGYAEGVINKVKVIKRRAYGIPTFTAFRQRVLLACG
jgi:transposase